MLAELIESTREKLAPATRAAAANLNFNMQPQQQTQWCWAAVTVSTSRFYRPGTSWTQCVLVNQELGQSTCCQNGSSAACNKPWYLDRALRRTGNLASFNSGTVPYGTVQQQINSRRALGVRIAWSGGGGHFVVLDGYSTGAPGTQFVSVRDPIYGTSTYAYARFVNGYQGSGSWSHTYYTKP